MKLVKIALGLIVLLAAVVFGGALLIDPAYAVSRSVRVQATPEKVYALVDSSAGWARWGVWYQRDPQMKVTETGAARGTGAAWSWTSESQGNGAMTLTEVQPGQRVAYELRIDGFDASQGAIELAPMGSATQVTWRMHGRMSSLMARWFGFFMDRLVGGDFEGGLANLKALAEQPG